MAIVDIAHRWLGGLVGLVLALLGLSGTLLLHERVYIRATVPHAADAVVASDPGAAALAGRFLGDPVAPARSIRLAGDGLGVARLAYGAEGGAYADQSGRVVTRWSSEWQRPEIWLFDLHHHLFAGETGTVLVGWAGLAGIAFVASGVLLWWRTRRTFEFRPLPRRLSRPAIVRHHRDLAIVIAPLLMLSFVTGAAMALKPFEALLLAPFGGSDRPPRAPAAPRPGASDRPKAIDWAAVVGAARQRFPDGELRWIGAPSARDPRVTIRMRRPGDWVPNGRTMLWLDRSGRLLQVRDAAAAPLGGRIRDTEYPLHAGAVAPWVTRALLTLSGLGLTMLGTLAVWSFWFRRPRGRRAPTRAPLPSAEPIRSS